jgi:hypothetical protein
VKDDWLSLTGKVGKRITLWCNRWLLRGGHLVLVKSILEAIPMFWHMLSHIPKGILKKIGKFCFYFLWQGSSEYKGTQWVNWRKMATPKSLGG